MGLPGNYKESHDSKTLCRKFLLIHHIHPFFIYTIKPKIPPPPPFVNKNLIQDQRVPKSSLSSHTKLLSLRKSPYFRYLCAESLGRVVLGSLLWTLISHTHVYTYIRVNTRVCLHPLPSPFAYVYNRFKEPNFSWIQVRNTLSRRFKS